MNDPEAQNYLLIKDRDNSLKDLFQIAVSFAEKSCTVLYISSKPLEKLPAIERPDKDILQRIIFMYFEHIDELAAKLLELHTWSISPKVILIDSIQQFSCSKHSDVYIEKLSLVISTLFNCVQYLNRQLNGNCMSVVSVDCSQFSSFERLSQAIVDLYYYKATVVDIEEIINRCV